MIVRGRGGALQKKTVLSRHSKVDSHISSVTAHTRAMQAQTKCQHGEGKGDTHKVPSLAEELWTFDSL